MFTLRPYQEEAAAAATAYLTDQALRGRHGLIVQPTGAGKSLVIASVVDRLDGPCVVLQPGKEILAQNAAKLAGYGRRAAVFSASFGRREIGQITLATIGSVVRHAEAFRDVPYVLIDECHAMVSPKGGMYLDFLDALPAARILGLTATPFRLASNSLGSQLRFLTRTRPRIFRDVVHVTQVDEMVRGGWWAPLAYRDVRLLKQERLRLNSTGADYTDASVQRHLLEVGFVGRLVQEVAALLDEGRRHVLVFTRFVDESRRLAVALPGTAVVTAETPPAERDRIVADFRAGRIRVVANVGVLTLGFDFPALDTVVLGRPSISLALYYQMVGRAVRPHQSKAQAVVVDMVGLRDRFGDVERLAVRPGGFRGEQWAVYAGSRAVTNVYFTDEADPEIAKEAQTQQARRQYFAQRAGRR